MVELKTDTELAAMREAGRVVATTLAALRDQAAAGVSLLDLDALAVELLAKAGATSSFLNYHPRFAPTPFPGVICASVNDVIVHGIPGGYRLRDGDLLSLDFGACLDGFHGDSAMSFTVGPPCPEDAMLIADTERALAAAIAKATVGARLGDVSAAVGRIGRAAGYGIPQGFGGHGIGRAMHEEPSVPNEGIVGRGLQLRPGLVIAIEPMFLAGGRDEFTTDEDGWALRTADGSRAAHAEHSVAITEAGPVVLTMP
jgi:methionyl aminopeptidase